MGDERCLFFGVVSCGERFIFFGGEEAGRVWGVEDFMLSDKRQDYIMWCCAFCPFGLITVQNDFKTLLITHLTNAKAEDNPSMLYRYLNLQKYLKKIL